MVQSPSIEVRHLRKVYGDIVAVDDLSFAAAPGAVLGLLGGNGAGKTTTIAMLLGLLEPTAGEIFVLGI
ncbi:MAG: ATP-binding cassette domain-containing protein, partial [Rhodospirillaceae bacterium]